jgi:hypothetical protein
MSYLSENIEETLFRSLKGGFCFYFCITWEIIWRNPILVELSLDSTWEEEKIGIFNS